MPAHKRTPQLEDQLRRLVDSGCNDAAISVVLGVSRQTVRTWRRQLGLPPTWTEQLRYMHPKLAAFVKEGHAAGWTTVRMTRELAERDVVVAERTVWRWFQKLGLYRGGNT